MARRKLVFSKNGEQTPINSADESSDEEGSSDSNRGKALKKPKSAVRPEPEHDENGSTCSTPTTSGFIILPAVKPGGKKKPPASRKFSDEEVIALLKGLALFWRNGRNNKWAEFHEFVKGDLGNKFSKIQVSEKIRSLKKKFERARANGGRHDFSDPHELLEFELSQALWGDDAGIAQENGKSAAESSKKSSKREQLDASAEEKNTAEEQKQEGEHGENRTRAGKSHKRSRKREQLDAPAEEKNTAEGQKQEDEQGENGKRAGKSHKKSRKGKQLVEEENVGEKQKQEDEDGEDRKRAGESHKKSRNRKELDEEKIAEEQKLENGHGENSYISKQGDEEEDEEDHTAEKGKQVKKEYDIEGFQSDFPLLYASFDKYGFPTIAKEKCVLIPPENAEVLEEKWRELDADLSRLELKMIELIKRDLEDRLRTK